MRPCDPVRARAFGRTLGVTSTLAQLLLHRGVTEAEAARAFLKPQLAGLSDPSSMADRGLAAERLVSAIRGRERIVIFGDYDVDGTTAAAILTGILRALGGDVTPLVAERFSGGYGFSEEALARARQHAPQLVVTCDCGSSDHPRLRALGDAGIDVIVVDHHLVPDEPLPALAFLNPQRPDCAFAYKGLCSAGLVLSLGAAVRAAMGADLDLRRWLDLVALGTIADVAPLDGDNRRLVRAGLRLLGSESVRPGLQALKEIAKLPGNGAVTASDVAFRLTPRLNAPGRLGNQQLTLDLLLCDDMERARGLAAQVEAQNQRRKAVEADVTEAATAQVRDVYGPAPDSGIVVGARGWHQGVVGITAARLVDRFGVPAVVVALGEERGHGSCRAPDGFRLFDAVSACEPHLLRYGGHQAASGVTLHVDAFSAFREAFGHASRASGMVGSAAATQADIRLGEAFDLPTASELYQLEPLGQGNAEPVVHIPDVAVERRRVVGDGHLKLDVKLGQRRLSVFGLGMSDASVGEGERVQLLGILRPDTFRGGDAVELRLSAVLPA